MNNMPMIDRSNMDFNDPETHNIGYAEGHPAKSWIIWRGKALTSVCLMNSGGKPSNLQTHMAICYGLRT